MKATHIRITIASICLAMIGLISIQIYWIMNAFSLERDKVEHSAAEAISDVVDLIERHEMLTKLKSHQEAKYLFFQDDDSTENVVLPPDDSLLQYVMSKNLERKDDRIELKIIEEIGEQRNEKNITHSVSDLPYNTNFEEDIKIQLQAEDSFKLSLAQSPDPLAPNMIDLRERVKNKKAFVADIVKSLIEVNLNQPIDERIEPKIVDSLLQLCFHNHGLNLRFEMAVFNDDGHMVFGREESLANLKNSSLSARLFPNDVIQLPYYLHVFFPNLDSYLFKNIWLLLVVSLIFILAIIFSFYYILRTVILQKKSSEIKNDFINNMTHELKTPISTISLACEALSDPELSSIENVKNRYIGIINAENKRLALLVEEVLQSAVLDKGDFKLKKEALNLEELLNDVIDKFSIQVKEKEGNVLMDAEPNLMINADKNHFSNVIYNLLDNALKYTRAVPEIKISAKKTGEMVRIGVHDNGIGISAENVKKVFDRLYRVPTGNVHNVKGFGLGLSYVKIIAERHGGRVYVESQLGQGSVFYIELPLLKSEHGNSN